MIAIIDTNSREARDTIKKKKKKQNRYYSNKFVIISWIRVIDIHTIIESTASTITIIIFIFVRVSHLAILAVALTGHAIYSLWTAQFGLAYVRTTSCPSVQQDRERKKEKESRSNEGPRNA